jgi:hypothetical protein
MNDRECFIFIKVSPGYFDIVFYHDSVFNYSLLKLFTGFAIAAFID